MGKKTVRVTVGGKQLEIINAARECFLRLGYEGTSIREIMRHANAEVGLFYYYFDSKDDAFNKVLEYISEKRKEKLEAAYEDVKRDPFRALNRFLTLIEECINDFRLNEADKLHRTAFWATNEIVLNEMEPYVYRILQHSEAQGIKFPIPIDILASILSHGIGNIITNYEKGWLEKGNRRKEVETAYGLLLGIPADQIDLMFPDYAKPTDEEEISSILISNKQHFPLLKTEYLREEIRRRIAKKEILIIKDKCNIAGIVVFSQKEQTIKYIFTSEKYRGKRVATRLLITALADFPEKIYLEILNYKEEEMKHPAADKLLKTLNFKPKSDVKLRGEPFTCQVWAGKVEEHPPREKNLEN